MKVAIVCYLDGVANSVRAKELETFLLKHGHQVKLINTYQRYFGTKLERRWFYSVAKAKSFIMGCNYFPRFVEIKLKARSLKREICKGKYDIVICELFHDAYVLTKRLNSLKIWDCPTPWTAELRFERNVPVKEIEIIEKMENKLLKSVDYICFHWETYADFIKWSGYKARNLFILNWGCQPNKIRAVFKYPPRIIYLGNLAGGWIDKTLLKHLVQISGNIDVYGIPKPEDAESLNYKGYANPEILRNYQFGLITVDKNNELHCNGFSAKHLEYISYGLPVLVPEWRNIPGLKATSIPYNVDNFLSQVAKYSVKEEWQRMSDKAYEEAQKLDWNITLQPLAKIIETYDKTR